MAYGDAESIFTGYANRIKQSPTTFVGTQAQWNALSSSQKAEYELVDITDDSLSPSGHVDWESNGEIGAKNILENEKSTQTISGVTFTVNSDGSVIADGTATDIIWFQINNGFKLNDVEYTLTGCPIGGGENTYEVQIRSTESSSSLWQFIVDRGNGATGLCSSSRTYIAFIGIKSGVTVTNLLFKPMLRLATDSDSTYQPYAMTNKQITPYVQAISNPNLLDNPWFTVNQRGLSSYTSSHINTYTVDRWRLEVSNTNHSVTVNNDGSLTITNSDASQALYFSQPILKKDFLVRTGTNYVASVDVLSYSGTINVDVGLMDESPWYRFSNGIITSTGINTFKGVVPDDWGGTIASFRPLCFILSAGASMTIRSVKLERGTVSTLAMDSIPNHQQELAKCQRYFCRIGKTTTSNNGYELSNSMAYNNNYIWFVVRTPVPLRAKPTISKTGAFIVTSSGTNTAEVSNISSFGIIGEDGLFGNSVEITLAFYPETPLPAGTLQMGHSYMLRTAASVTAPAYIDFSADL